MTSRAHVTTLACMADDRAERAHRARDADRDYVAEMNALIEQALEETDEWATPVVAQKLCARLLEQDPELLTGYLDVTAEAVIQQAVVHRVTSHRARLRASAQRRAFADAAKSRDPDRLGMFSVRHCVDDTGTWKTAANMTGAEHTYVALGYERRANTERMEAAFHYAIAKKAGPRRTSEVMDEQHYERLYQSIVKQPRGVVA
jgi:hypothetical protein